LEVDTFGLFRDTRDLCDVANRINGAALRNKLNLSEWNCYTGRRNICRSNISELQAHYMDFLFKASEQERLRHYCIYTDVTGEYKIFM